MLAWEAGGWVAASVDGGRAAVVRVGAAERGQERTVAIRRFCQLAIHQQLWRGCREGSTSQARRWTATGHRMQQHGGLLQRMTLGNETGNTGACSGIPGASYSLTGVPMCDMAVAVDLRCHCCCADL